MQKKMRKSVYIYTPQNCRKKYPKTGGVYICWPPNMNRALVTVGAGPLRCRRAGHAAAAPSRRATTGLRQAIRKKDAALTQYELLISCRQPCKGVHSAHSGYTTSSNSSNNDNNNNIDNKLLIMINDTKKHRDQHSCSQLDEKCIAADVSTDCSLFSWIFTDFH